MSNSRGPHSLVGLFGELGADASAGTAERATDAGDGVIVTVPGKTIDGIPVERDAPAYEMRQDADELRANLGAAEH